MDLAIPKIMKTMTKKELNAMVGCAVSYKGREGTIISVDHTEERRSGPSLRIFMFDTNMVAVVRPSELAS